MREITLPPELRVGQGYGRVRWAVRTIWESYVGWFRLQLDGRALPGRRPRPRCRTSPELAGAEAVLARARQQLADGEPRPRSG